MNARNPSFFDSNAAAIKLAREELARLEKAVDNERRRVVIGSRENRFGQQDSFEGEKAEVVGAGRNFRNR